MDSFLAASETAVSLDVVFIFIQADRGTSFETGKMGTFVFAVRDFFADPPQLPRTPRLYATTGQWTGDTMLDARRRTGISELESKTIFNTIVFDCIGADILQKLYRQAKNAVARDFTFSNHAAVPEMPGVTEAYLGFIPAKDFLSIIASDDGEIMRGIFESNLRDFQGPDNRVNAAITSTLSSDYKARFVLMNNGVTIIARVLRRTAHRFHIEDFQIVNGCQTSNVLFDFDGDVDDVMIPLRLISSDDDDVIQSIVTATNQQTQLSREQLFAATEFPKKLEQFFQAYEPAHRLYYERRSRQYDRQPVEKVRIVTQANTIRAFAGMFLEVPHQTTRTFNALLDNVGRTIFVDGQKLDPYYVSAFSLYKLERLFRNQRIPTTFKAARFQILLAARRKAAPGPLPQINAREMETYCKRVADVLWDQTAGDELLEAAAVAVSTVANGNLDRDNIRTVAVTDGIKGLKFE
jgi:hypothetical protein